MADEAVRRAVLDWRAQWQWPRGTALAAPAHLHLTLHFLGEVPESRIPALRAALATVPVPALRLHLGRGETWARGLVVLRPEPDPSLDRLHAHTGEALRQAGIASAPASPPLAWKPHLTLARKAAGAQPPPRALALDWAITGFELVWSRLPPTVPRATYEVLERWEAAGAQA